MKNGMIRGKRNYKRGNEGKGEEGKEIKGEEWKDEEGKGMIKGGGEKGKEGWRWVGVGVAEEKME